MEPGPQLRPLFHGTSADIQHDVLPARVHGGTSHWGAMGSDKGQASRDHAFATTDEMTAWSFSGSGRPGRARVYEVGPHPAMRPGVHTELHEMIAPSFPVKRPIDIMPGQQGTLTGTGHGYDWNQHVDRTVTGKPWEDKNHPQQPTTFSEHGAEFSLEDPVEDRNAIRESDQDAAHAKWVNSTHQGAAQATLFDMDHVDSNHPRAERARHHDLQHLVRGGKAPVMELDHHLAGVEHQEMADTRRFAGRWGA